MYGWKSLRIWIVCDTLNSDNGDADGSVLCSIVLYCIVLYCIVYLVYDCQYVMVCADATLFLYDNSDHCTSLVFHSLSSLLSVLHDNE